MKVAKEKGRDLRKTAKRGTYTPSRRSKKGQEVKNFTLQQPSMVLSTCDGKQFSEKEREVFKLYDIDLEACGQLCAIVGLVGIGKSSLVQGMIGGLSI